MTQPSSELINVNPSDLVLGANVRLDRKLDQEFLTSIEEHGVLQPIVGYRNTEGEVVVRYGSRRTLAAVQVGRPTVPVVVGESPDDVDRIATQVAENESRTALTTSETVAAVQQLAAFGLSASVIARRTGAKRQTVKTALAVSGSELASKAADRYELTLDQAAAVAEFETSQEAITALVAATRNGQFDHVLQRLRDDRDEAELVAAARAELVADGVAVIDRNELAWPGQRLDNIGVAVEDHHDCEGHAAFLAWKLDEDRRRVPSVVFVCIDAVANGHVRENARPGEQDKRAMTDEEKVERKRVIRLNKAWTSSTTVRREWLASFARLKTAPAGAEMFVLTALLSGDHEIKQAIEAHWPMLREAIGSPAPEGTPAWIAGGQECLAILESLQTAPAKRVLVVLTVAVLLAWEAKTGPHTWRQQNTQNRRYLEQMAAWGYALSAVERIACGQTVNEEEV